jgi:quercetin dioxygenase-like cupin family protein
MMPIPSSQADDALNPAMPLRSPLICKPGMASVLDWSGKSIEILCESEHTCGLYSAQFARLGRGEGPIVGHAHSFGESFYLLSGRAEFTAGNASATLQAGDFIHIEGGTAHRFIATQETELLTICAPAGFEVFQRRAMLELERRVQSSKPIDELDILAQLAPQFGIDLSPPDSAWDIAPMMQITRRTEGSRIGAVGDIYRFLAEGEHTSGAYAIWHATIFPGGGPPPHVHHWEEEGFYLLKGTLAFYGTDRRIEAGPGTFINLPRHQLHHFHNETNEPAETLIVVAPAGLEKMFRKTGQVLTDDIREVPKPSSEEIERLLAIVNQYGLEIHTSH